MVAHGFRHSWWCRLGVGSWFDDNVRRVINGGGTTYFWTDNWVGGVPLRICFPRLFDLSVDKGVTVEVMASKGWGVGGGALGVEEVPFCVGGGVCQGVLCFAA